MAFQMESDLQVIVKGMTDDLARAVDVTIWKVVEAIKELDGELDLRRMHRIIVAEDFAEELAELSAATASGEPITHTTEEYAVAVAKVVTLPSGEDYEIVPVVSAHYVLALLASAFSEEDAGEEDADFLPSELFGMVLHGLHHELCHVHDQNKTIDAFGTLMLSPYYAGKDAYLYPLAEVCWSEYIADFMSTSTVDSLWLGLMTNNFGNAIERTKPHFDSEILAYRLHGDLERVLDSFQRHGVFLAKSAAYILGYVDGLNTSLSELSADTYERLSNSYFESTWNEMHEALREMRQRYPNGWRDPSIYDSLATVLESYYAKMGLILSTTAEGQMYVDIPFTPETTP
jgi:hypothetical protein